SGGASLMQTARESLRRQESPFQIRVEYSIPFSFRKIQCGAGTAQARIVDENVRHRIKSCRDLANTCCVADIKSNRLRRAALAANGIACFLQGLDATCGQHHRRAMTREQLREMQSEPA